jgi:hypothetical protein
MFEALYPRDLDVQARQGVGTPGDMLTLLIIILLVLLLVGGIGYRGRGRL